MALPEWHPPEKHTFQDFLSREAEKEEKEDIFVAVGSALNAWEGMEMDLALLFHALIEAPSGAAYRAYGTIQGAEGRRNAIEAAAVSFFRFRQDPLLAQVFSLTNSYSNTAPYRNNIAHSITLELGLKSEETGQEVKPGCYLLPHFHATRRFPLTRSPTEGSIKMEEVAYMYRVK
jgi:hypothetical protein